MSPSLRDLTDRLVRECIRYDGGPFVILADDPSMDIGEAIGDSANAIATTVDRNVEVINIDEYRSGKGLLTVPADLRSHLEGTLVNPSLDHNALLYIFQVVDGEGPMRKELADIAGPRGKIGGLPSCTVDVLAAGFHPDNDPRFSEQLFKFIQQERTIFLTSKAGSRLTIDLDHARYDLVNSNGVLVPGKYGNPILAEVFAHPLNVQGTYVINGSYGPLLGHDMFRTDYRRLLDTLRQKPMVWTIANGRVTKVKCEDELVESFVRREIFDIESEFGPRIGEFGLPANLHVLNSLLTGNFMIDEKGRVHIAHGDGYKKRTRCEYESKVHGDGLSEGVSLFSGRLGLPFMRDDKYIMDILNN